MRKTVILLAAILLASTGSALNFDVHVDALTESSEYKVQYRNNTSIQEINTTILNSGSIGCQFRLKGEFKYRNQTQTRYSNPYSLFPGEEVMTHLYFIPENYTGNVETTLYTEYCGQEKQIKEFNFSSPESVIAETKIESKTVKVNKTGSRVNIEAGNGRLVPKEAPAYWKTGSAEIVNGTATVEYDAPIFQQGKNLTYTVLNSQNQVIGETKIHLKARETIWDKIRNNLFKILLSISVAFNIILVILRLRDSSN